MKGRVQCSRCPHLDEQDWCQFHVEHVPYPRHWRRCTDYAGLQPIATIRRNLAMAGLLLFVEELKDTNEGRLLRLVLGTPAAARFEIYRMAGLRILDTVPARLAASDRGNRGQSGRGRREDGSPISERNAA